MKAQRIPPPFGPLSSKNAMCAETGSSLIGLSASAMRSPMRARSAAAPLSPLISTAFDPIVILSPPVRVTEPMSYC